MASDTGNVSWSRERVRDFIAEAHHNRANKQNETVVRQTLIHHLSQIITERPLPWWVSRHIRGAEAHLKFLKSGKLVGGHGDSIIGLTAIEYESDLTSIAKWQEGFTQVRQYCAGLLNEGARPDLVRGVLSDTVDWYAYELSDLPDKELGLYDADDITLAEMERVECDPGDENDLDRLIDFWLRHFAREGTRPLTARSLTEYLAPSTPSSAEYLLRLSEAVEKATTSEPGAAEIVETLWTRFVSYLSEDASGTVFDRVTYVQEFYVALLARLICANVLARQALRSSDADLEEILRGHYFSAKGLKGLVEYDYFGWLTIPEHIDGVRALAKDLQQELAAFDFTGEVGEDLFGEMVSSLAGRAQRLLLGQEWTPTWLAEQIAEHLMSGLPDGTPPRFVDMCCGSGAMLVAVTRIARHRALDSGLEAGSQEALNYITNSVTGFDIDPLAVLLSKVNWVVSNRDWLEPFDGSRLVTLPMYHADSLFALAPVFSDNLGDAEAVDYQLQLDDVEVPLPGELIRSGMQGVFDGLIDRAYNLGVAGILLTPGTAATLVDDVTEESVVALDEATRKLAQQFVCELVAALSDLHARGRNGIWAFVLRNSFRPALVAGRFNGLIANPPWLALSRIEKNPFSAVLKKRASRYGLLPPGAAAPHLDMSTPFLAYAVDHYLADGALVGCVLPGTIRRGTHHRPFREQVALYRETPAQFELDVTEVWQVSKETFKNLAVVVFGKKQKPATRAELLGSHVSASEKVDAPLYVKAVGDRVIWADSPGESVVASYGEGYFQQGADLMPRTCVFVSEKSAGGRSTISALSEEGKDEGYLVNDSKKARDFRPVTRTIPSRFIARAWISKHLAPFDLCDPAPCIVPFERTGEDQWERLSAATITAVPGLKHHLEAAAVAAGASGIDEFAGKIDYRLKLSNQSIGRNGWLVLYGAGGTNPAAAYVPSSFAGSTPVLVDQTLYWAIADSEDEALFQVGMLNSLAVLSRVREFAPEGAFNERHLHTLPSKFLPKYDTSNGKHAVLVSATRALIDELAAARTADASINGLFVPHLSLPRRRRDIRRVLTELSAFPEYDAAADDIYA